MLTASVTGQSLTKSISFNVRVDPCPLTSFTTDSDAEYTYTVKEASLTTAPYGVPTQFDACNYPQSTDITSSPALPSYITHNAAARTYTVNQVTDNKLKNTYVITVTHTVTYIVSAAQPTTTNTLTAI